MEENPKETTPEAQERRSLDSSAPDPSIPLDAEPVEMVTDEVESEHRKTSPNFADFEEEYIEDGGLVVDGKPASPGYEKAHSFVTQLPDPIEAEKELPPVDDHIQELPAPNETETVMKAIEAAIYSNAPDLAAAQLFSEHLERLSTPLHQSVVFPATTEVFTQYPLEWLELDQRRIFLCKLPSFGLCRVFYSHPLMQETLKKHRLSVNNQELEIVTTGEPTPSSPPTSIISEPPICETPSAIAARMRAVYAEMKTKRAPPQRVLFLTDFTFGLTACAPFLNALAEKHEVLAFDWPGYGGSDRAPHDEYSLDVYSRFCLEVLQLSTVSWISSKTPGKQKFTLIGHGEGAVIAAAVAPSIKDFLIKTVLLAPVGVHMTPSKGLRYVQKHGLLSQVLQPFMGLYTSVTLKSWLDVRPRCESMPEPLRTSTQRKYEAIVRKRCGDMVRQFVSVAKSFPWEEAMPLFVSLAEVSRVCVLLAADDPIINCERVAVSLASRIPDALIRHISTGGHDFHLVRPADACVELDNE